MPDRAPPVPVLRTGTYVVVEARKESSPAERFAAAGVGSAVAEMLTLPSDTAKVRLQMQVETGSARRYTGLAQGVYRIAADEGAATLWRGFQPALLRQISYTGMSFVLYEPLRNMIAGDIPKEEIPFYKRVLAGGAAGGISIVMMNPTDVVKTQARRSVLHLGRGRPPAICACACSPTPRRRTRGRCKRGVAASHA